jgi:ElaB/YqjD/DUF883 family membrane-anchored ribosome-binding protein
MTNEELLADLKQLIDARASATERYLEQRMATKEDLQALRTELKADIQDLRTNMDDQFNTVLDAIGERFDATDAHVRDYEDRLSGLERRVA